MAKLKPKNITLQAYEIENNDLKSTHSDLLNVLIKRLNNDTSANERRMKLHSSTSEEDVLTDYSISETGVWGVLMRISPTLEVPIIPDSLFEGKTVRISSSLKEDEPSVTVINTAYFYVGEKGIISTLPPSQIKRLQVYLNYLLSFDGNEIDYKFNPTIIVPDGIKLSEMREFIIGEQSTLPIELSNNDSTNKYKIIDIAKDYLFELVNTVPNLDELVTNKILNARLLITFAKPRKMTETDYKKFLSSSIKPIADCEDVRIRLKNKKTLKGKDVLFNKVVSIERLDKLRLNEAEFLYEMKNFLKEI